MEAKSFKIAIKDIDFKNIVGKPLIQKQIQAINNKNKLSITINNTDNSYNPNKYPQIGMKVTNVANNIFKDTLAFSELNRDLDSNKLKNAFHKQIPLQSPIIHRNNEKNINFMTNMNNSNQNKIFLDKSKIKAFPLVHAEKSSGEKKTLDEKIFLNKLEKKDSNSRNYKKMFVNKEFSSGAPDVNSKFINPFQQNVSYLGKYSNLMNNQPISTKNNGKNFNFEKSNEKHTISFTCRQKVDASNLTQRFANIK